MQCSRLPSVRSLPGKIEPEGCSAYISRLGCHDFFKFQISFSPIHLPSHEHIDQTTYRHSFRFGHSFGRRFTSLYLKMSIPLPEGVPEMADGQVETVFSMLDEIRKICKAPPILFIDVDAVRRKAGGFTIKHLILYHHAWRRYNVVASGVLKRGVRVNFGTTKHSLSTFVEVLESWQIPKAAYNVQALRESLSRDHKIALSQTMDVRAYMEEPNPAGFWEPRHLSGFERYVGEDVPKT